eukprot:gene26063-11766_t
MNDRAKRARVDSISEEEPHPWRPTSQALVPSSSSQPPSFALFDLPSAILNLVVKNLSYGSLPQLRLASKLAMEVVDSASDGWLLKPSELELLKTNILGGNILGTNILGANILGTNILGTNILGANILGTNILGTNILGTNILGTNMNSPTNASAPGPWGS